jgi:hypothetical protein
LERERAKSQVQVLTFLRQQDELRNQFCFWIPGRILVANRFDWTQMIITAFVAFAAGGFLGMSLQRFINDTEDDDG